MIMFYIFLSKNPIILYMYTVGVKIFIFFFQAQPDTVSYTFECIGQL